MLKMRTISLVLALMFAVSANSVFGQKLKADPAKSQVKWTGNKVGGSHNGEVKLKSGELEIKGDQIVKGNFVIDMTSIVNNDLEDKEYNQKLVGHLKSDDFFGVEKYPTSTLVIKKSTKFVNNKATVTADLSIKGKTDEIVFDVTRNDKVFTSKIEIDRSKYDVRYGSKSFFDNLGDKVIDDIFILDVKLVCL